MLLQNVKKKDSKMAKFDKKDKSEKIDVQTENAKTPNETENKKATPQKTSHFMRNLIIFVFLLLAGFATYSTLKLKQQEGTDTKSMQSLNELRLLYEQKLNTLNTKITDLQNEVLILKNRPVPTFNGVSEEYVNQRFMQLEQELSQHSSTENIQPEIALANNTIQTKDILLASGAIIVQDLAEQGNSFEYETEVLQILAQGNPQATKYVDTMQKYAVSGVKGKNMLISNFNKIFADLNMTKVKNEQLQNQQVSPKWQDRLWVWLKKLLVSKKGNKRPIFKEKEDEIYTLVNEGRLGEALNAVKTSEKYLQIDSEPLANWQKQTTEYLEFKHAVSGLIMNSLANLHLKEMEH